MRILKNSFMSFSKGFERRVIYPGGFDGSCIGDLDPSTPAVTTYVRKLGLAKHELSPKLSEAIMSVDSLDRDVAVVLDVLNAGVKQMIDDYLGELAERSRDDSGAGVVVARVLTQLKKGINAEDEVERGGVVDNGELVLESENMDVASAIRLFVDMRRRELNDVCGEIDLFMKNAGEAIFFIKSFIENPRRLFLGNPLDLKDNDLVVLNEVLSGLGSVLAEIDASKSDLELAQQMQSRGSEILLNLIRVGEEQKEMIEVAEDLIAVQGNVFRRAMESMVPQESLVQVEKEARQANYLASLEQVGGHIRVMSSARVAAAVAESTQGADDAFTILRKLGRAIEGLGLAPRQKELLYGQMLPLAQIMQDTRDAGMAALEAYEGANNVVSIVNTLGLSQPKQMEALMADVKDGRIESGAELVLEYFPQLDPRVAEEIFNYMGQTFLGGRASEDSRLLADGAPTDKHQIPEVLMRDSGELASGPVLSDSMSPEDLEIIATASGPRLSLELDEGFAPVGETPTRELEFGRHPELGLYMIFKGEAPTRLSDTQLLSAYLADFAGSGGADYFWPKVIEKLDFSKVRVLKVSIDELKQEGALEDAARRLRELSNSLEGYEIEYIEREGVMLLFPKKDKVSGDELEVLNTIHVAFGKHLVNLSSSGACEINLEALKKSGSYGEDLVQVLHKQLIKNATK